MVHTRSGRGLRGLVDVVRRVLSGVVLVIANPQSMVVVNGVIRLQSCALYKNHRCAILNAHHICPESWYRSAGLAVDSPMIDLCPNCHFDVHASIDGVILKRELQALPPRCVLLSQRAFALAQARGLTPALTL